MWGLGRIMSSGGVNMGNDYAKNGAPLSGNGEKGEGC